MEAGSTWVRTAGADMGRSGGEATGGTPGESTDKQFSCYFDGVYVDGDATVDLAGVSSGKRYGNEQQAVSG